MCKYIPGLPQPGDSQGVWMPLQIEHAWSLSTHVERAGWPDPSLPTFLVSKPAIKRLSNPSLSCSGSSMWEEESPPSLGSDAELSVQERCTLDARKPQIWWEKRLKASDWTIYGVV